MTFFVFSCCYPPKNRWSTGNRSVVWKGQEGTGDPGVQNDPAFTPVHVLESPRLKLDRKRRDEILLPIAY